MNKFKIGRHINVSPGFLTTPAYAKMIGSEIFQIFLGVPEFILSKARPEEDLKKFAELLEKMNQVMVVHGSYTINLCQLRSNNLYKSSVKSLVQDLKASAVIGKRCLGVIIHMGKNIPANKITYDEALQNYVSGLKEALENSPENSTIILETGAGQGNEVASKIDDLSKIYNGLTIAEKKRVKFCIDTCHSYSYGYDLDTATGAKNFFKLFDELIGIDRIACIHFNDSKVAKGACVDRHDDLNFGSIGEIGLKTIAQIAKKNNIPLIMETPLEAINEATNQEITFNDELALIKSWIK